MPVATAAHAIACGYASAFLIAYVTSLAWIIHRTC